MYHVVFVCTGNICRSPIADVVLTQHLRKSTMAEVMVSSCGIGGWHSGQPADSRALRTLETAGYDGSAHRAAQFGASHQSADLFIALDSGHVRELQALGVAPEKIRLLRSFDPAADGDLDVADPYYGSLDDFALTLAQVEAAIPGIIAHISAEYKG
ncbi:low molecular weight phosphotyrosine protein phosphatase [Corynebacterium sp. sy017]|uniref:low molecular weight protein-tyrosine-phosphatase n=1 Tax=unclassified Corynebacterium TaxID=2624378 RepID=UPI0011870A07|nr:MULTISPECIES: low molecular weight protein-tyrosine-phosphatase [unclassified Corynebacterium]MBP3088032.1 low molecular weight phosphotyrosine protein phosphatase [Corynebacterium sp. sy017]QDZ42988.1 low molecular weight phosphotyrosine protein phosphatase [Corynebacterium sp. sy039]TSD92561.1 low molecular weight phosphotyrosine protein phosphatase [Corynebacterium sp. SY003]